MLSPRDNRQNLAQNDGTDGVYPTIVVEIKDDPVPGTRHEMTVLDINDSGMGVTCNYPLTVGQTIEFIEEQLDWEVPACGVVMWTFKANEGFQAGIQFTQ